jgi:predicted DCC family thiol-disulfide oxidoreductase YuxK
MDSNLKIFIDGWCPNCRRFEKIILKIDICKIIEMHNIRELQKSEFNIDFDLAKKYMASIDSNKNIAYGYTSIYRIFKTLPLLWVFVPILFLLHVSNLGEILYNELAVKRKIIPLTCDENSCQI